MFPKIHELASLLGLSEGEALKLARSILADGRPLRTIDLLTKKEGERIIAELEKMMELEYCASVV